MESTLLVMRLIRAEMRRGRPANLSVTQLRALIFAYRQPEGSLSELAEHLGLGMPTTSKLAASLARRGLVEERITPVDRRRRQLRLTPAGAVALRASFRATRNALACLLGELSPGERAQISCAMTRLRPLITPAVRHGSQRTPRARAAQRRPGPSERKEIA